MEISNFQSLDWYYEVMYNDLKDKSFSDALAIRCGFGKTQDQFIYWCWGVLDGVGDNPKLSEHYRQLVIENIRKSFDVDYDYWWELWRNELTS